MATAELTVLLGRLYLFAYLNVDARELIQSELALRRVITARELEHCAVESNVSHANLKKYQEHVESRTFWLYEKQHYNNLPQRL